MHTWKKKNKLCYIDANNFLVYKSAALNTYNKNYRKMFLIEVDNFPQQSHYIFFIEKLTRLVGF